MAMIVDSPLFPKQVALFVKEVQRIKAIAKAGKMAEPSKIPHPFYEEFSGTTIYNTPGTVQASYTHGLVVSELGRRLKEWDLTVGKDQYRDLYVNDQYGRIATLIEVKKSAHSFVHLHQLLLNSVGLARSLPSCSILYKCVATVCNLWPTSNTNR
jgi:hypothetical protein